MAHFEWQYSPEDAFGALVNDYIRKIAEGIYQLARRFQPEIERWMKLNRPWTDRSNKARLNLHTEVEDELFNIAIALYHGMEYGLYLETGFQGRYAIIGPAVDEFAPKFWQAVKQLVEG